MRQEYYSILLALDSYRDSSKAYLGSVKFGYSIGMLKTEGEDKESQAIELEIKNTSSLPVLAHFGKSTLRPLLESEDFCF